MPQARSRNQPYSAYSGASLKGFGKLAPKKPQTGAKKTTDLRHESQQRALTLPRFHENGHLCILAGNVAGDMAEMAVSAAAFPEKRPPVHSGRKRGQDYG